ncbi:hypothetical protein K432DRAFT_300789, partial [Lepidopterella palustris CBS 459.81]
GSEVNLNMALHRLQDCISNHKDCRFKSSPPQKLLPTRVLDHLYFHQRCLQKTHWNLRQYLTLSYYWR